MAPTTGTACGPVPLAHFNAVRRHVDGDVAAMMELQLLCGITPAELCAMRPADIDRARHPWTYRPADNRGRVIFLGRQAREIVAARLDGRAGDRPVFRPLADYRAAVLRGAERAGVPPFAPERLRLTAALEMVKTMGLEMAGLALGLTPVVTAAEASNN